MSRYRVTVDTGGTFSDFVYFNESTSAVTISKLPSTPDDPSRAILQGIESLLAGGITTGGIAAKSITFFNRTLLIPDIPKLAADQIPCARISLVSLSCHNVRQGFFRAPNGRCTKTIPASIPPFFSGIPL